ncbi:MAG: hypothetical protein K2K92_01935, partial [Duncaniella sp.]|nr:hypothetical protein [Duncaniella sp.]
FQNVIDMPDGMPVDTTRHTYPLPDSSMRLVITKLVHCRKKQKKYGVFFNNLSEILSRLSHRQRAEKQQTDTTNY